MIEVVGGIIHKDDKLVLVKNRQGFWVLPGGKVDKGESRIEALRREIREELGGLDLMLNQISEYGTYDGLISPIGEEIIIYTYWINMIVSDELEISNEIQGIGGFDFSDTFELNNIGNATKEITNDILCVPFLRKTFRGRAQKSLETQEYLMEQILKTNPGLL
ncbi:NUDIX domain-containing protein [Candidatus Gracilibacteria bacterium 28_42_T64]|nr:NUDIX domain-containing protein [Candidatus Gracilibacteria bacterium 28_42_T64]